MPTDYESVIRSKCPNGTLYRSDEKLAAWLAVPVGNVPDILDSLISAEVLRFDDISSKGTERYKLGIPTALGSDAVHLYWVMLSSSTASGVVTFTTLDDLADAVSMDTDTTRTAFGELRRAGLVDEDDIADYRCPVILRRVETFDPSIREFDPIR